jgi:hypothetical protein
VTLAAVVCPTKDVVEAVFASVALEVVVSLGLLVVEEPTVVCIVMVGNSVIYDASDVVGADIEVTVSAVGVSVLVVEVVVKSASLVELVVSVGASLAVKSVGTSIVVVGPMVVGVSVVVTSVGVGVSVIVSVCV